jgi:hypothetical protein
LLGACSAFPPSFVIDASRTVIIDGSLPDEAIRASH